MKLGSIIQCNWCTHWHQDVCDGISEKDTVSFWVCPECRQLPQTVRRIEKELMPFIKENERLKTQLESQTKDLERLEAENARLRQRLTNQTSDQPLSTKLDSIKRSDKSIESQPTEPRLQPVTQKPTGTLLVGSSIIRNITERNFHLNHKPICIRGER